MEDTNTGTYEPTDKLVLLSPDELETIAEFLPTGATVVGGMRATSKALESDYAGEVLAADAPPSVIVIYTKDDHTIHSVVMTEVKPNHYELTNDHVIGHW